ncbi:hypothetical protein DLJ61_23030 [Gordonia terrae]|uniref:Uncharacterized protein n=2 Tax=Gordonia terrae TaxID=2055 RepID=A0AAD0KA07_9ACTN|nr:hypothetical protein BCM27_22780 [Gordonia terrae]AWO86009.1 hypothetical protein DLJ61_23030 [Gordonia terrae]GAB42977.1 hypothetical protein GOTRE_034_00190 [Gordonia terrae NBRC 100016]VTS62439.1 Uncharacterised protein [Gordonia terrae]
MLDKYELDYEPHKIEILAYACSQGTPTKLVSPSLSRFSTRAPKAGIPFPGTRVHAQLQQDAGA